MNQLDSMRQYSLYHLNSLFNYEKAFSIIILKAIFFASMSCDYVCQVVLGETSGEARG